ncbi:predicted protein [Streptomyces iranensis]|uniref:Uncharacterized protein n=1 Tax=Streptomyces iranensis TaxID=576784 RepID=A0A060ZLV4_9ACTN|nr:predicted protein [Streptomyces iranensis]
MLDFSEPISTGRSAARSFPYVASSAPASIGSPSGVPVPWASIASICSAVSAALASAWRITRCWARPLGAVRPLLAPSWLTAEPRTTASTLWPLRRASERRSSSSMPTPSPRPMPSAPSANALQRPSCASPRCRAKPMSPIGAPITAAPPARASEQSPWRSDWQARWRATSEDEQAVSMVTAGPSRPRV